MVTRQVLEDERPWQATTTAHLHTEGNNMKYIVEWVDHKGEQHTTGLLSRAGMILATDHFLNDSDIDPDLVQVQELSDAQLWAMQ